MSKSDPDSAIFMEDSAEDVKRKIKKAFCPPQIIEKNPIIDYAKSLIFGYYGKISVVTAQQEVYLLVIFIHYSMRKTLIINE